VFPHLFPLQRDKIGNGVVGHQKEEVAVGVRQDVKLDAVGEVPAALGGGR